MGNGGERTPDRNHAHEPKQFSTKGNEMIETTNIDPETTEAPDTRAA